MPVKRIPLESVAIRAAKTEAMVAENAEGVVAEPTLVEPAVPSSEERQQASDPAPGGLELRVQRDTTVDPHLSSPAPQAEQPAQPATTKPSQARKASTASKPPKPPKK